MSEVREPKRLMKGNEAVAEAAIRAGCRTYFGYPITPQNELAAYMSKRMPQVDGVFVQAESETSAINMVYGASAAGARVLTSSSSPGVALKAEGLSYLAGADLPSVIINIQRGGPGLGTIQPSQGDYFMSTKAPGHGDFKCLVYAPATVQEMADMVGDAFEKADQYRMPALILSDGLLGQMMEPVALPPIKDPADCPQHDWAMTGTKGERAPMEINSLQLYPEELEAANTERYARYDVVKANEQAAELYQTQDAEIIVVAYGASARTAKSAVDLARDAGIKAGMVRPLLVWPYPDDSINDLIEAGKVKGFLTVEMSMGQMVEDVRLVVNGRLPIDSYNRTGGLVPDPQAILAKMNEMQAQFAEGGV
ncbi:MAG: 3-methyl-2-oxobutanoate dehydrogenase subunit VorB [Coriobacteriia bacterium]|nr:3-methyl-2-oxobutanoate dehydrogenase subunit VorB [Coriobacteriia bacterium]MCL2536713.1 3-methyl-2-oxobutanoate dehydrogenase subunit VorB [Coriobacteriia bacterium]